MVGLTTSQAQDFLKKYGPNTLPQKHNLSALKVLVNQLKNPFSLVLVIAVLLSFVVGDAVDAILIGTIFLLNTLLGFWQEYKASKELEALKSFEVLTSRVIRDGIEKEIPAYEIVPEDVVILESGDKVPADGEILENYSIEINESILTGESMPVIKTKQDNKLYFGTTVLAGRCKYKVLQTGSNSRFGNIAHTLTFVKEEKTPLEISLSSLIKGTSIIVFIIAAFVAIFRYSQGVKFSEVILSTIALMVAAVPEGLPAVVTVVLALGVRKMYQKKALVRKMIAVESLGSATVILSDKTGTLTKNEMRVQDVKLFKKDSEEDLLKCAVLCNSANLILKEDSGSFDILGDTTEGALLLWVKDKGYDIELMRSEGKLDEEIPFSLTTRKMTVVWVHKNKKNEFTKGAPEVILKDVNLSKPQLEFWDKEYQKMAKKGLRVLGFSKNKEFLGFVGIADQIRPEAKEAIKVARSAGIKVMMVTGDNELTAKAVSEQLGLMEEGDNVLTGHQLNLLSEEELKERLPKIKVFARIAPEDKLRLVRAYQSLGEVVAVTGDGVNDSLALKQGQVGVAMGKTGSDVAKEASDIILLDDNFASLITAVEQGRVIYSNILKVVKFLMTGNLAEVLLISLASFLALPAPLLPTQILWINFVSDGLPALALGFDSPSSRIMTIPPKRKQSILTSSMVGYILTGGLSIGIICLGIFWYTNNKYGLQTARALTFTLMVVLQMILPFIIRRHHSIFSNKKLFLSVILMLILQVFILTIPFLRNIFSL